MEQTRDVVLIRKHFNVFFSQTTQSHPRTTRLLEITFMQLTTITTRHNVFLTFNQCRSVLLTLPTTNLPKRSGLRIWICPSRLREVSLLEPQLQHVCVAAVLLSFHKVPIQGNAPTGRTFCRIPYETYCRMCELDLLT